jgi:hypothetical protein
LSPPYSHFKPDLEMVQIYRRNAEGLGRTFPGGDHSRSPGSTDMANVSLALPAIQPMVAIDCDGSSNHQPKFARHCVEPSADEALLTSGLAMAWAGIDLATDTAVRSRLLEDRETRRAAAGARRG